MRIGTLLHRSSHLLGLPQFSCANCSRSLNHWEKRMAKTEIDWALGADIRVCVAF
jgi:hypothetical protein